MIFGDRVVAINSGVKGVYINGVDGLVEDPADIDRLVEELRGVSVRLWDQRQVLKGWVILQEAYEKLRASAPSDDFVTLVPVGPWLNEPGLVAVRLHKNKREGFEALLLSNRVYVHPLQPSGVNERRRGQAAGAYRPVDIP